MEASNKEEDLLFKDSRLFKVLDVYQHTIQLLVMLPDPSRKPSGELDVKDALGKKIIYKY